MFSVAVILFIAWLLVFFALHATSSLTHVLLVAAVIVLVVGLVRRRSSRPSR
jgi:hypothetical protein